MNDDELNAMVTGFRAMLESMDCNFIAANQLADRLGQGPSDPLNKFYRMGARAALPYYEPAIN